LIRTKAGASGGVGEHQQTDLFAVVAGDDDVLRNRRERRDRAHAQTADVNPGSRHELEVLRDAAIEHHTAGGVGRIGKASRVADLVEALCIKRCRAQLGPLEVSRRDVGPAHPHFQLLAAGQHQQFAPGCRNADHSSAIDREMHAGHHRCRFGGAPG
jgi:hypothetical protein